MSAEERLLEIALDVECPIREVGDVFAAALRYAAEVLAAMPPGDATTYGLVCQFLEVAAKKKELL